MCILYIICLCISSYVCVAVLHIIESLSKYSILCVRKEREGLLFSAPLPMFLKVAVSATLHGIRSVGPRGWT